MSHTLITGNAGFFGRHLAKALLDRGDMVVGVDSMVSESSKEPEPHERLTFHRADFRDWAREQAFDTNAKQFDYVFHCAAIIGGRFKIERHPLLVADDLSIDAAFWQWVLLAEPKKIINFSSSAVYPTEYQGKEMYRPLEEKMCDFHSMGLPDLTYGWAKLTSEYLGKIAYERHSIPSVVYRPFSGYGEDQADSYPVPHLIQKVKEAKAGGFVPVWGSGEQMRDFVHIDDCVRCVLTTMDMINDGSALNISSGVYTSFVQFIKLTAKLLNKEVTILPKLTMPVGVWARAGDTRKQKVYGFEPGISLEEGIKRFLT